MKIVFCGFGNPDNRGCEAIIRTTTEMTKEVFSDAEIIATSNDYGRTPMLKIDTIDKYEYSYYPHSDSMDRYVYAALRRVFGSALLWCKLKNMFAYKRIGKPALCVSVGGDNFCYGNSIEHFIVHHNNFKNKGSKLVHWGTSFEKELMSESLIKDLNRFDAIMVRESISYDTLVDAKITSPVYLIPDPAFVMKKKKPDNMPYMEKDCVGINISPMVVSKESKGGIVRRNAINLINHITKQGKQVVLIPHVCSRKTGEGDYSVMKELLDNVDNPEKCLLVGYNYSAPQIKHIISNCDMFIGARTHATIAAYSTCVPTVVIGYSVKARGIARDLFGTEKNYVLPVQSLENDNEFIEMYEFLAKNKEQIKQKLLEIMPQYIHKSHSATEVLKRVMEEKE